ncbi:MAG: DUF2254 domain-containing protein [Chloroflexia bacterium]|nr:DUF2254 domain-containing protein [Chloroflexia bacterium]
MHPLRDSVRQAFASFLAVPTAVIVAFVLLAFGSYAVERTGTGWFRPVLGYMEAHVFGDPEATSTLLGTIATGVITITSITFSLLLLALQQSAGSLTHQVFDQFLRRRSNQVYFGFFVGLTLYALITLATVAPPFNPVLGATLALVATVGALYVLLLLIYSTINQMRPGEIIKTIHDHTLRARQRQLPLLRRTRRAARLPAGDETPVLAPHDGYLQRIDLDTIAASLRQAQAPVEIVFEVPIGAYVAYHDRVAGVRAERGDDAIRVAAGVEGAIRLGRQRDIVTDPAYGIEQLTTIAWRSVSTSQQNPAPGIATVHNLHDLLVRWAIAGRDESGDDIGDQDEAELPVVYPDDVMMRLFGAFESLAVVASESMQAQVYAQIVRTFALAIGELARPDQRRTGDLLLRTLPGLGDHVLTTELDDALTGLVASLERADCRDVAEAFRVARAGLAGSIGTLNSRATRVPTA